MMTDVLMGFADVLMVFAFAIMFFSLFLLIRNNQIYRLRIRILDEIGVLINNKEITNDIRQKIDYTFIQLREVSYHNMLWRIFTPIKIIEKEFWEKVELKKRRK